MFFEKMFHANRGELFFAIFLGSVGPSPGMSDLGLFSLLVCLDQRGCTVRGLKRVKVTVLLVPFWTDPS